MHFVNLTFHLFVYICFWEAIYTKHRGLEPRQRWSIVRIKDVSNWNCLSNDNRKAYKYIIYNNENCNSYTFENVCRLRNEMLSLQNAYLKNVFHPCLCCIFPQVMMTKKQFSLYKQVVTLVFVFVLVLQQFEIGWVV